MNELCEKFPGDLAILSFPSNQFGHQENGGGEEIVNLLKHVRPGNGFEFKGDMFDKVDLIRQFFFLPFCIFLVLKLMFAEPNTFFFYLRNIIVWTGGGEWRE